MQFAVVETPRAGRRTRRRCRHHGFDSHCGCTPGALEVGTRGPAARDRVRGCDVRMERAAKSVEQRLLRRGGALDGDELACLLVRLGRLGWMGDRRQAASFAVAVVVVDTLVRVPSMVAHAAHRAARRRFGVAADVDGEARCWSSSGRGQRSAAGVDADHGGDVALEPAGCAADALCRARRMGRGSRLLVNGVALADRDRSRGRRRVPHQVRRCRTWPSRNWDRVPHCE